MKKLIPVNRPRQTPAEALHDILYVEDEDSNWNVTDLHLRNKYNLTRARDSQETFERLREHRFDLILLDIQLSGSEFDGIEICKILKKHPGQPIPPVARNLDFHLIPLVFVTAYASRYAREMLLKVGADDVITKPVDYPRLHILSSKLIENAVL